MARIGSAFLIATCCLAGGSWALPQAQEYAPAPLAQLSAGARPRPEAVAETRLLMEGINLPNYEGLEKHLREKPADTNAWKYVRGQALLIAENANLLMLRPPRNAGEAAWLERAAALRTAGIQLARTAAERDFTRSRAALIDLAHACNQCHSSFHVAARATPFRDEPQPGNKPATSRAEQPRSKSEANEAQPPKSKAAPTEEPPARSKPTSNAEPPAKSKPMPASDLPPKADPPPLTPQPKRDPGGDPPLPQKKK